MDCNVAGKREFRDQNKKFWSNADEKHKGLD
jgi:hypothetical protein